MGRHTIVQWGNGTADRVRCLCGHVLLSAFEPHAARQGTGKSMRFNEFQNASTSQRQIENGGIPTQGDGIGRRALLWDPLIVDVCRQCGFYALPKRLKHSTMQANLPKVPDGRT